MSLNTLEAWALGYDDGFGCNENKNPFDESTENNLWFEYEQGYFDGQEDNE